MELLAKIGHAVRLRGLRMMHASKAYAIFSLKANNLGKVNRSREKSIEATSLCCRPIPTALCHRLRERFCASENGSRIAPTEGVFRGCKWHSSKAFEGHLLQSPHGCQAHALLLVTIIAERQMGRIKKSHTIQRQVTTDRCALLAPFIPYFCRIGMWINTTSHTCSKRIMPLDYHDETQNSISHRVKLELHHVWVECAW